MAKTLSVCEQGYRATVEEQDDTIVWLTHMLQKAGADTGLLLRGSAVNYAHSQQDPPAVQFGQWRQRHPANLARDLTRFMEEGGRVYANAEDLERYGVGDDKLIEGVKAVDWAGVAALMDEYDVLMNW